MCWTISCSEETSHTPNTSSSKTTDEQMQRPTDSMSWERTAGTSRCDSDQILVFGYSAKLFKDDEQATLVEKGRHLVPCQGQPDLRIDRFDVRGFLSSPQSFEPEKIDLSPAELEQERLLDEERFKDLISDEVVDAQEEEIKKLRHELALDGAYSQVAFSYDQVDNSCPSLSEGDDEKYSVPEKLTLPVGLNLPKTMRDHKLIEKTAHFVHMNGPQMEIVLKIKQSSNPAFSFLNFDSPLNQYFRYILSVIKSGKYVPQSSVIDVKSAPAETTAVDSESDDDDGSYLHPSLMGCSSSTKQNAGSIATSSSKEITTGETAGKSSSDHPNRECCREQRSSRTGDATLSHIHLMTNADEPKPTKFSILPPPPQDVQVVIDKLAEKVAKAGEDFETSIKRRADPRFEFLNPGNCFHAYYVKRKLHYIEENQKAIANSKNTATRTVPSPSRNISFSFIRSKNGSKDDNRTEPSNQKDDNCPAATGTGHSASSTEAVSREKQLQEERKRKAALFLSLLKSREKVDEDGTDNNSKDDERDTRKQLSSSKLDLSQRSGARDDKRDRSRRSRSRDRGYRSRDRSPHRKSRRHEKKRRRSRSRSRSP